jgi:hypothetical protein
LRKLSPAPRRPRSYDRPKRVQRSSRDGRVALDPPAVGPAENDDCKSSIPGCWRSATISGVAFGRSYEHRMNKTNCDGAYGLDQPRLRQGEPWVCATRRHGDRNLRQGTIQKQVVQIGPPLLGTLRLASKDPVGRHPHADPGARRAPGVGVSGDSWRREAPERSWRQRVAALRACRADARTDKCSGCC